MASCRDCIIRRKFGLGITDIMDQIYQGGMNWTDDNPLRTKVLKKLLRRKIITQYWWSFARIKFTKLGLKLYERWSNLKCNFNCAAKQFTREWTKISKEYLTGSLQTLAKDQHYKELKRKGYGYCLLPEILVEDVILVTRDMGNNTTCSYTANLRIERSVWGNGYLYFYMNRRITKNDFEVRYAMHLLETA